MRRNYGFSVAGFAAICLLMSVSSCSKEAVDENLPEYAPPYELRLAPPWARFESDWFEQALENGDKSVFSKTILVSGGTAPYRIEPEKERYIQHQGGRNINIKITDFAKSYHRVCPVNKTGLSWNFCFLKFSYVFLPSSLFTIRMADAPNLL